MNAGLGDQGRPEDEKAASWEWGLSFIGIGSNHPVPSPLISREAAKNRIACRREDIEVTPSTGNHYYLVTAYECGQISYFLESTNDADQGAASTAGESFILQHTCPKQEKRPFTLLSEGDLQAVFRSLPPTGPSGLSRGVRIWGTSILISPHSLSLDRYFSSLSLLQKSKRKPGEELPFIPP